MNRRAAVAIATVWLVSCGGKARAPEKPAARAFNVLAGSELKDVETQLSSDIRIATGLDLKFTYSGTLDAIDRISAGEVFDALWVSHGKYLSMNPSLKDQIVTQEKIMLSPVLLGLKASRGRMRWDGTRTEPTWKDISDAAKAGKSSLSE